MKDSIFLTIKSLLGLDLDYTVFDMDVLILINSALSTLTQIGIGPSKGFVVTGETEKWTDLLGDATDLNSVKQYIFLKVKMAFDPPTNSFVMDSYKETCKELEWRLNVAVDPARIEE